MNLLLSTPIMQSHESLGIAPTTYQPNLIHASKHFVFTKVE